MLLNQFLILGAVLFCIGVYGVIARRNAVLVLMSIELILKSVNINLLASRCATGRPTATRSRSMSLQWRPQRSASAWQWCCSCTATVVRSRSTTSQR